MLRCLLAFILELWEKSAVFQYLQIYKKQSGAQCSKDTDRHKISVVTYIFVSLCVKCLTWKTGRHGLHLARRLRQDVSEYWLSLSAKQSVILKERWIHSKAWLWMTEAPPRVLVWSVFYLGWRYCTQYSTVVYCMRLHVLRAACTPWVAYDHILSVYTLKYTVA